MVLTTWRGCWKSANFPGKTALVADAPEFARFDLFGRRKTKDICFININKTALLSLVKRCPDGVGQVLI